MEINFSAVLAILFLIQVVLLFFTILLDNRDSAKTYSWILLIVLLPILGLILYLLFGRNWRKNNKKRRKRNKELFESTTSLLRRIYEHELSQFNTLAKDPSQENLARLAYSAPYMFPVSSDSIKLYTNGRKKFEDLIEDIKNAKKYIHIEYYIITSDYLVDKLIDALCEKAQDGIEVRIFYDWIGSFSWKMRDKRKLRQSGAIVASGKSPLDKINYRSHRKIISIDGSIAYIGGMNMSSWYVDGGNRFKQWRDNHLRITGNFAISVGALFAQYWFNATGEQLLTEKYIPTQKNPQSKEKKIVQLIHSGADTEWSTVKNVYEKMISLAEEYIWLETPYFIPEGSIYSNLINAALSGVKVNIILAGVSDNIMSQNASFTYFKELLIAGVNIFLYTEGFMHGKALSIDGKFSTVGSANLDTRSMEINYEANVIIYDKNFTSDLEKEFQQDLMNCRQVSLEEIESAGTLRRLRWSLFRLFSPLL